MTELSRFLLFAHSIVALLGPNISPVRPANIFERKEGYRRRISHRRVCACHPENPHEHYQLSDAIHFRTHILIAHPPLIQNKCPPALLSYVVFNPPHLAKIDTLYYIVKPIMCDRTIIVAESFPKLSRRQMPSTNSNSQSMAHQVKGLNLEHEVCCKQHVVLLAAPRPKLPLSDPTLNMQTS